MSKERERIQDESANGEGTDAADINTRAYDNIKNTWAKRGIWNRRWVYYLGCRGSMNGPLRRKPPTILRLFQRTRS
jgi:hypothetical protein